MGAELSIIVFSRFRGGNKIPFLAQIVGPAHANEASLVKVIFLFRSQRDGVDEHCEIMGIATDDLDEIVLAFDQSLIIDTASVHLAKTVFAALGDETAAVVSVFIIKFLLVFIAYRSAVNDDAGSLNGFFGFEGRLHSHVDEFLPAIFVHRKLGAFTAQHMDFRTVGMQRGTLVERDFVDPELLAKRRKNPNQRLTDSSGSHHMDDLFLSHSPHLEF